MTQSNAKVWETCSCQLMDVLNLFCPSMVDLKWTCNWEGLITWLKILAFSFLYLHKYVHLWSSNNLKHKLESHFHPKSKNKSIARIYVRKLSSLFNNLPWFFSGWMMKIFRIFNISWLHIFWFAFHYLKIYNAVSALNSLKSNKNINH